MKIYDLFEGKLITDDASISLGAIVAFQGETVILENGDATALRAYLKDTRQRLERIQPQA